MKVNEKRIIGSVVLTQDERNFLNYLADVIENVCETHPYGCENCPLSNDWDCDNFKGMARYIAENGGFENDI